VNTVLELGSEVELPPMVQCGPEYRTSHTRLASLNTRVTDSKVNTCTGDYDVTTNEEVKLPGMEIGSVDPHWF
jgi:hypothetical protein